MSPSPPFEADRPAALIIGAEAWPFAKTGGLADVLGALPPALARLGWDVTVVLPKYRGVTAGRLTTRFPITVGGYVADVGFYEAPLADGARAILVDVPELYDRDGLYQIDNVDYPDNARRFAVLVRAALEFAAHAGVRPSVVHGHDWHAGLAPVYLRTLYADHPVLGGASSVFTIHNLAYQGNFDADWLPRLDLPSDVLTPEGLEFWGQMSFMKGGLTYADAITTVSATYAREIQTAESGFGLDGVLRRRGDNLTGILNGIDTAEWDPEHDRFLPAHFTAQDLSAKRIVKAEVLRRHGLADDPAALARPLIAMISRMVDQKGFDLVMALADELPSLNASFVVLGTGERRYEEMWRSLAKAHPSRIGATIGFDEGLAHLIEGGADIFLMPSRWEPCGLNQMYSLRYGTVPVVRAVGGLADTVIDASPVQLDGGRSPRARADGTGFVFHEYTPAALLEALGRALTLFKDERQWRALQRAGMKEDHSWDRSAREYVKIYGRARRSAADPQQTGKR